MNEPDSAPTNDTPEESKNHDFADQSQNVLTKLLAAANKKYHFEFELYGWIIGIIGILLLAVIFS